MNDYLTGLNKLPSNQIIEKMATYAKEHKVPIINEEGMAFINQLVKITKPKRILEIGTAIGYSAINMALSYERAFIDTIERDANLASLAIKNIKECNLENRIRVFNEDALKLDLATLHPEYDLIFIDAAKSQYKVFFEKFDNLLISGGIIITDNILFHGLITTPEHIASRNLRQLVRKIGNYNTFLKEHPRYDTTFYNIGDGIAVSIKVK